MEASDDIAISPAPAANAPRPESRARPSLEERFSGCVSHLIEVEQRFANEDASQFKSLIRHIDDSYFRLQIWGSDMSAGSEKQVTFDDILKLTSGVIHETISDILARFERNFASIENSLDAITAIGAVAKIAKSEQDEQKPDDLLQAIRNDVSKISEQVRSLVELSGPLQMEQALLNDVGPYSNLQKQVNRSAKNFHHERSLQFTELEQEDTSENPIIIRDTNSWARKYVLSLDGGGVRGWSSLFILRALMAKIENYELKLNPQASSSYFPLSSPFMKPIKGPKEIAGDFGMIESAKDGFERLFTALPCHYFDYIAGSNTGGLIAIMLGRLQMTVEECIEGFLNLATEVYGKSRFSSVRTLLLKNGEKYDHRRLEAAIKDMVRRKDKGPKLDAADSEEIFESSTNMCKTIALASQESQGLTTPYLFRSYDHPAPSASIEYIGDRNPGPAAKIPIWQVARATSAAPTYFKPMVINDDTFLDGGILCNNPAVEAFREVEQMNREGDATIALVLSIGTGVAHSMPQKPKAGIALYRKYLNIAEYSMMTSTENVNHTMNILAARRGLAYHRLDVDTGLEGMRHDDWNRGKDNGNSTRNRIEMATKKYLGKADVQRELEELAQNLVHQRRLRSQSREWELFCRDHRS